MNTRLSRCNHTVQKKVNGQACPTWRLSEIENIIGSTDNHFSMGHYLSCFSVAIEHVELMSRIKKQKCNN